MLLALLTLFVTPSFAGVAVDAQSHAARVEHLRDDLHRAMLALYMENAESRVDAMDRGVSLASPSPAAAGSPTHEVPDVKLSEPVETPNEPPATIAAEPQKVEAKDPVEHQTAVQNSRGMPFGQLETFGREDTAQELTDASIAESNKMIDQVERAVVAETKRSMFRALTRLRGVTVSSYDGMANAQAGNIDDYARQNKWTKTHKIKHLAEKEGNVENWAFANAEPVDLQLASAAGRAR